MNILRGIYKSGKAGKVTGTAALILAAALISVSCAKNELKGTEGGSDAPKEISFNIIPVKTGTKAATFSTFPTSEPFGTIAWYLPSGKSWRNNSAEAEDYIPSEKITFNENIWKAWESEEIYWWPKGGSLTFFSWAPYSLKDDSRFSLSRAEGGIVIKDWRVEATPGYGGATSFGTASTDGATDILTARSLDLTGNTQNSWATSDGASFTGNGAKIQFTHALCKLRFVISLDYAPEDPDQKWYVEKAELKDIYTCGTFKGTAWTEYDSSSIASYSLNFVSEANPDGMQITEEEEKTLFPRTMMIPQPLTSSTSGSVTRAPRIEVDLWNGGYDRDHNKDIMHLTGLLYSNTTEIIRWKEGTDITYHIFVSTGKENYIEFDASAESWESLGGQDIELQ